MSKVFTFTVDIADGDRLLDLVVARVAEILVARLLPEAIRCVEEAVDKSVAKVLDDQIAGAVDRVLADGIEVRDEWGAPTGQRILLAEMVRRYLAAQLDGRETRLDRLVRTAAKAALEGPLAKEIADAVERVRALLDQAVTRRLAEVVAKVERR